MRFVLKHSFVSEFRFRSTKLERSFNQAISNRLITEVTQQLANEDGGFTRAFAKAVSSGAPPTTLISENSRENTDTIPVLLNEITSSS